MKIKLSLIAIILLAGMTIWSCKKETNSASEKKTFAINFTAAKTNNELTSIKADPTTNLIRSLSDFDKIVSNYATPLSKLTADELSKFRSTLVTRENSGVVSIDYSVIQSSLSSKDFNEVMSYFGIDSGNGYWGLSKNSQITGQINASAEKVNDTASPASAPAEHNHYWCESKGNCKAKDNAICLDGC